MSEQAPLLTHEVLAAPKHEVIPLLPTPEQAELLREGEEDPILKLEAARQHVETATLESEKHTNPIEDLQKAESTASQRITPMTVNSDLKKIMFNRTLLRIQKQLPAPEKLLSKVIHQPVIRAVSESTSKTLTRPSGLLGGGVVAFLGTSAYVYFTRHIGVPYNYLLFILFFVGGFALGLVLEFIIWVTANRQKKPY
jgi:hypothetical protein